MSPLRGAAGAAPTQKQLTCALELCGRTFSYDPSRLPPSFPFCSKRCKEVDLGMWVTEEYRAPASPAVDEELSELDLGERHAVDDDDD